MPRIAYVDLVLVTNSRIRGYLKLARRKGTLASITAGLTPAAARITDAR